MFKISNLQLPIVQAPMAGGPNTPALAAAVANAGGLGSFGFAYSTPEKVVAELQATRRLTGAPLNANFFVFSPVELPPDTLAQAALEALSSLPGAADLTLSLPGPPFNPDLDAQLAAIWQEKPEVLTFHFGVPPQSVIDRAHESGIAVGICATSLAEAQRIEAAGADFIVAQGAEAGGHRGIFDVAGDDEELPTFDLLAALQGNTSIPLVAAGGIMNGKHVVQALQAGAAAVQMGTAFLTCAESGASETHRHYLLQEHDRGTAETLAWSGRPARSIKTQFMHLMEGQPTLPFPLQNSVTRAIRQAAAERGDAEYQSLWAGGNYSMCRAGSAAELMRALANEIATRDGR